MNNDPPPWEMIELQAQRNDEFAACLLALRSRIAKLEGDEATRKRNIPPGPQEIAECGGPCETQGAEACDCRPPTSKHDLLSQVTFAINFDDASNWQGEARNAIRAVANWLEARFGDYSAVRVLRRELEQTDG